MAEPINVTIPETLMNKLNEWARTNLSKEEKAVLGSVFDVYNYAINHRCSTFSEHPDFIKEINNLEEQVAAQVAFTPTITTITITTTIASHPIITCAAAAGRCE